MNRIQPAAIHPSLFEMLEGRRLLGADLPFTYYYPEGFANDGINEFVPITNPNNTAVTFELHARYETGERDALIASGTIDAHSRGGVTVTRGSSERIVRPDTPYALVLKTSGEVGATMAHYDFGTAIGESFTEVTATEWSFGEGFKDPNWTRDFVLFYNPNDTAVNVVMTVYTSGGQQVILSSTVEGQRRSGYSLNDDSRIPDGVFGMRLVASGPIVAALSHYEIVTQRGFGAIGTPGGGAVSGVVQGIEFDNDGDPTNGNGGNVTDGPFSSPFPSNSYLTVLNTSNQAANVRFTFGNQDNDTLPNPVRDIVVQPGTRGGLTIRDLDFPITSEFHVIYTSDVPVTVTAGVYEGRDAIGMQAVTTAATVWTFGEGFISDDRAGAAITEDLYVFNPSGIEMTYTIEVFFNDGTVVTVPPQAPNLHPNIHPVEFRNINLHTVSEIISRAGNDAFFGIRVTLGTPGVAMFEHWDRDLGGGFSTPGTPSGTIVVLDDVLVLNSNGG
ncbi:MAG: hypothetical protein H7Y88_06880 [Phycisphaerales bacterium]|nr:hypothetical protein [Phycisphaerales bacterium]